MSSPSQAGGPVGPDGDANEPSRVAHAAIFEPSDEAFERYAWLREHAPVFFDPMFGSFVVSGYTECRYILQNPDVFRTPLPGELTQRRPGPETEMLSQLLVNASGERHKRLRSVMSGAFSPGRLRLLRAQIERSVKELLDSAHARLASGEVLDFHSAVSVPLPQMVVGDLVGIPREDRLRLSEMTHSLIQLGRREEPERRAEAEAISRYYDALIEERRRQPREDLISTLIGHTTPETPEDKRIAFEDVKSMCFDVQIAGYAPTVACIDNLVATLVQNPALFAQLEDEPATLRFIEEVLRWACATKTAVGTRFATRPVTLAGVEIPVDGEVYLLLGATHRDPRVYAQADTLDFGRRELPPLTYGAGPHYCAGAPLANLEMSLLLRELKARMPNLRLAGPVVRPREPGLAAYGALPVRLA